MPAVTVRSVRVKSVGAKDHGEAKTKAHLAPSQYLSRTIRLPSVPIIATAAVSTATDRLGRGGKGLNDTNPMPGRLESMKIKSKPISLVVGLQQGPVSREQEGDPATTTQVDISGPKVEKMQVTAKWVSA